MPDKCKQEGYNWVAWRFLKKQEQLLSSAQTSMEDSQWTLASHPSCAGLDTHPALGLEEGPFPL